MRYLVETLVSKEKDYLGIYKKVIVKHHIVKVYDLDEIQLNDLEEYLKQQIKLEKI